jgi:DNA-binding FadR family transcriptional regulator
VRRDHVRGEPAVSVPFSIVENNGRLVQLVEMLRDQTRLYGLRTLAKEGKLVATSLEHFGLLDAVLAGDPDRAAEEMTKHLAHVRGDWADAGSGQGR